MTTEERGLRVDWLEYVARRCADKKITRADMALTYASLLREVSHSSPLWAGFNFDIKQRWSLSGLLWIKREAWKQYEASR